jgi:hypothetical protein
MLKIRTQLGRALRYQALVGAGRSVGHFDDSAKDLSGPATRTDIKSSVTIRSSRREGTITPRLRVEIDPATGGYRGVIDDAS